MSALYIIGGLLAVLIGVSRIRVGMRLHWGDTLTVLMQIGPKKNTLIPPPERKPKKTEKKEATEQKKSPKARKKPEGPKLTSRDILELLETLWQGIEHSMDATAKRIRIDPLRLNVTFGGDDPCVVAELYGGACSALWTVMPRLEQTAQLPDPEIHLGVDFTADKTRWEGDVGVFFRLGDFVTIGISAVGPLVRWYSRFQKRKKQSDTEKSADSSTVESKTA